MTMNGRLSCLLLLTVATMLLLSGCCSFGGPQPSPSVTPSPAVTPTSNPSVTPVPGDKLFDIGNRLSMMYLVTQFEGATKTMETTDVYDYQKVTLSNGHPGYMLQYISSKKGSSISIMIRTFYDASGNAFNGTYKRVDNGVDKDKIELGADAILSHDILNSVVRKIDTAAGFGNITVTAGVFDCAKFTGNGNTLYMAEGVPVPVKFEKVDGNVKTVYELISWDKQ